jgi:hypothetical protein
MRLARKIRSVSRPSSFFSTVGNSNVSSAAQLGGEAIVWVGLCWELTLRFLAGLRTWSAGGKLAERLRVEHFYVDVRADNDKVLLPIIRKSVAGSVAWMLFFGSRSAGKSTRIDAAANQLQEEGAFTVLRVSMQRVNLSTEHLFWTTLSNDLVAANPGSGVSEFASAWEFIARFAVASSTLKKPVALFLDEFDLLHSLASPALQDSVLRTFRGMKEMDDLTRLRTVVGIGAFGVLELVGHNGSPFNARRTMQVPSFTQEQVRALFAEFVDARRATLDARIVVDIFEQTWGHAGSVAFMGRFIDERMLSRGQPCNGSDKAHIGYEAWVRAGLDMRDALASTPNMLKLINELRLPEREGLSEQERGRVKLVQSARKLLVSFLHSSEPVRVAGEDIRLARFLAAEGALMATERESWFVVPSAVVRSILCDRILPLERRSAPSEPVPMSDGKLLVAAMLRSALRFFDRGECTNDALFKKSAAPGAVGRHAAQEEVFQTEILAVLKHWFPVYQRIHSQPPLVAVASPPRGGSAGRPEHSDLLFIPEIGGQHAILLELAAQVSESSLAEHMTRAGANAELLGAEEAWVIHFTTGEFAVWPGLRLESGRVPVHVLHVKYDSDWTSATIRVDGAAPEEVALQPPSGA